MTAFIISALLTTQLAGVLSSCAADSDVSRACGVIGEATPEMLISEFYADAVAGEEYVKIASKSSDDVPLDGWQLTDGEGVIEFLGPREIGADGEISVSFNSSSYAAAYDRLPDYSIDLVDASGGLQVTGHFRLGDAGDSISLVDPFGSEVDFLVYGDAVVDSPDWLGPPVPAPREGEVLRRVTLEDRLADTDSALDWQPFRELRYGYTDHKPETFDIDSGQLCAFVSPDCALDVVSEWIGSARREVLLCSYEMRSPELCHQLIDALDSGVNVRLLVDGSPIGGMSSDEAEALSVLESAGADVRIVTGTLRDGVVRHFAALHSKYVVIDSEGAIVLSENFVGEGIPLDRIFGNRGWGVAVRSSALASYLANVFESDSRSTRPDVARWCDDQRYDPLAVPPTRETSRHSTGCLSQFVTTAPARVTLHVSPDANPESPFICSLMRAASDISVEQLKADFLWKTRWSDGEAISPLLSTLLDSLREGGSCRMLLDSSWYDAEDNGYVVRAMTAVACAEGLDGSFKLISPDSPIASLHNKGVLLDGCVTVISSNNWVYASFARNRELAAVVSSAEVAMYYSEAFDMDWIPDIAPPTVGLVHGVVLSPGERVCLSPEHCRDDRIVAEYLWDIGRDGGIDCREPELSYVSFVPGTVDITLTVVDAWGNSASATVVVSVVGYGPTPLAGGPSLPDAVATALPPMICALVLLIRMLRRRGPRCGSRPRNVKEQSPGSGI